MADETRTAFRWFVAITGLIIMIGLLWIALGPMSPEAAIALGYLVFVIGVLYSIGYLVAHFAERRKEEEHGI